MKIEFELDKTVYDYMRHRHLDFEQVINETLMRKFRLGKVRVKPQPYLPLEKSVELGLDYFKTDINDPQSVIELVNYIVRLYPFTTEESVMSVLGKVIKKRHKYDRFI